MLTLNRVTLNGVTKYVKDEAGQAMLAPEELTLTAANAYAVGDLFRYDGKLYKVNAAIEVGDTIEVGTNCEETTIAEESIKDVQVNGASIVENGIATIPISQNTTQGTLGLVNVRNGYDGLRIDPNSPGRVTLDPTQEAQIKAGNDGFLAVTTGRQHSATFYGLAKAAGVDMKDIANTTVGIYPDAQKEAIQSMLGISQMLAPTNPNLVATQAYAIGDVFTANGHLYKATAAIAQDEAIIPDTNCVETTMAEAGGKIKDVQVAGSSVIGSDGIASIPYATGSVFGVVRPHDNSFEYYSGALRIKAASANDIKEGANNWKAITSLRTSETTFYGLSKVAGVDLANETVTLGTYPETSKIAIKEMLGVQDGLKVVRLI